MLSAARAGVSEKTNPLPPGQSDSEPASRQIPQIPPQSGEYDSVPGRVDHHAPAQPAPAPTHHIVRRHGRAITAQVVEVGGDQRNGHALLFGAIADGCLVRIHSRCLYGDSLKSEDCDCGPELDLAMDMIQAQGAGVLVYLEQEGRGAGLVAKARGYALSQTASLDTFTSYARLGYQPDGRSYDAAADTLTTLGLRSIRLLTNNPEKVSTLRARGLLVEHLPLQVLPRNRAVRRYLTSKRIERAHRLPRRWLLERVMHTSLMLVYVVVVGGICAVAVSMILQSKAFGTLATMFTEVMDPDHVVPAVLGLTAGRCGWSRMRLLRARFQILRGRWSRHRIPAPER